MQDASYKMQLIESFYQVYTDILNGQHMCRTNIRRCSRTACQTRTTQSTVLPLLECIGTTGSSTTDSGIRGTVEPWNCISYLMLDAPI